MERVIDKFIKRYSEDLRFYDAFRFYDDNVRTIYVFGKNGRNVAVINIIELVFLTDKIRLEITISGDLYEEVSSVIGVTRDSNVRSFIKNRNYFKTQFGDQISDRVKDYVLQHYKGKSLLDPETLLSFERLDNKESEMVNKKHGDDRY